MADLGGGYSAIVTPNQYPNGFVITAQNVGGSIRSITVGNQTTATTVSLYIGPCALGLPLFTVQPAAFMTVPCDARTMMFFSFDSTTFILTAEDGTKLNSEDGLALLETEPVLDGSVFLHFDLLPFAG